MKDTILEKLLDYSSSHKNTTAFRYLSDLETQPGELNFEELLFESCRVAEYLKGLANEGDTILLLYPPSLAYVKAFFGCLLAGMIAVPLYPPRKNANKDRLIKVAVSCASKVALTTDSLFETIDGSWQSEEGSIDVDVYTTDQIDADFDIGSFTFPRISPESIAFLQYTSGSTGNPKGVMISHGNIVANMRHLSLMSTGCEQDTFVNWLPLFHDLGLVTAVLWPVYLGTTSILMAPATFVRNPIVWLRAISRYQGTMCGAPNFAYDLCVRKIEEEQLKDIDLSSWRVAYNAAEPVRADTIEEFSRKFSQCGFKAESFYPSYGMAEATVFITGGDSSEPSIYQHVDKEKFAEGILLHSDKEDALPIVACGKAHSPHHVRIVDPESCEEKEEGQVGEIWFSGPSVASGYWQLPDETSKTFNQKIIGDKDVERLGYLRTGDLGLIYQDELYVAGRIKDLIIVRGRNYYPQDVEFCVCNTSNKVRRGHVAAFSHMENMVEKLVVIAEIEREHFRSISSEDVISDMRQAVSNEFDVFIDDVVLLKPYSIPMTSSGKIQRRATKKMWLEGSLEVISASSSEGNRTIIAPRSELEEKIHQIWCRILKQSEISVTSNFFDVGGDSISAIEISSEVVKLFPDLGLSVDTLLEKPSIEEMAGEIFLNENYRKSQLSGTQRETIEL